jgi:hypothetical protein
MSNADIEKYGGEKKLLLKKTAENKEYKIELYFNEYQESLKIKKPGGKVRPARRADNLAAIY